MKKEAIVTWFSLCALAALLVTCTASCVPEDVDPVPDSGTPVPDLGTALGEWDVTVDATACGAGELRVMFDLVTHRGTPVVLNREGVAWLGAGVELTPTGAKVFIESPILDGVTWYIELADNGVHARATVWLDVAGCEVTGGAVAWRERG